jgi:hypothetical protein
MIDRGGCSKTRLVQTKGLMKQPLGKAVKCPLFHVNLRLLFQKLKFWNSLR